MTTFDYDLFVIGAGSGGVRAARTAARLGARVAIAEERYMGGTCVNVGCVPKKLFSYAAHYRHSFTDSAAYGWQPAQVPPFDWPTLVSNKNLEINRLNAIYQRLLEEPGVAVYRHRARLGAERHTVLVDGKELRARHILIATGGWPFVPEIPGRELAITSNEFFFMKALPASAVVVGGGYIGLELAGILAALGTTVTLVQRSGQLLSGFDADIRLHAARALQHHARLILHDQVVRIDRSANGTLQVELNSGQRLETETVLFATGRRPNSDDLGLEEAGVQRRINGAIIVDEEFRTDAPGVYAVGDVIDRLALTPVALAEGQALAYRLFGDGRAAPDYPLVPAAVFAQPPISTVGLTEEEARGKYDRVAVYRTEFTPMRHTMTGRKERTFMKMLVDMDSDRVVGLHMIGEDAPEIMQGFAVALQAGATKAQFDATIGIHPTAAEEFVTMREPTL